MAARTFVFGDIHGDFGALRAVLGRRTVAGGGSLSSLVGFAAYER